MTLENIQCQKTKYQVNCQMILVNLDETYWNIFHFFWRYFSKWTNRNIQKTLNELFIKLFTNIFTNKSHLVDVWKFGIFQVPSPSWPTSLSSPTTAAPFRSFPWSSPSPFRSSWPSSSSPRGRPWTASSTSINWSEETWSELKMSALNFLKLKSKIDLNLTSIFPKC